MNPIVNPMNTKAQSSYFSKKITFLNVMLTFSIVLLHAKTPERWGLPLDMNHPFIYWTHALTQVGVPSFFFVSGLLFYRQCRFSDIERKLQSRVHSLLIPYFVWNTLFVGIFFIMSRIPAIHGRMNMGEVFLSPSEILYAIVNARYTVLWFVKDLMLLCAISAVIFLLLKNKIVAFVAFVLATIVALMGNYGYEHPLTWLPVYFMGCMVGRFYTFTPTGEYMSINHALKSSVRRWAFALSFAILFLFLYVESVCIVHEATLFFFRLLSPIIIWCLVDLLFQRYIDQRFKVKRWMSYMFFIFCSHQFILNVLQKLVVLHFSPSDLVLNATFLLSPVLTVLIAIGLARLFSRYKFYTLLSGGR